MCLRPQSFSLTHIHAQTYRYLQTQPLTLPHSHSDGPSYLTLFTCHRDRHSHEYYILISPSSFSHTHSLRLKPLHFGLPIFLWLLYPPSLHSSPSLCFWQKLSYSPLKVKVTLIHHFYSYIRLFFIFSSSLPPHIESYRLVNTNSHENIPYHPLVYILPQLSLSSCSLPSLTPAPLPSPFPPLKLAVSYVVGRVNWSNILGRNFDMNIDLK